MTIKTNHRIHHYSTASTKLWVLMVFNMDVCSWLYDLLLPCPFKVITGFDCPGCGFQRSLLALLQGQWSESYHLYPPTVPLLVVLAYASLKGIFRFDSRSIGLKVIAVACGWFVIGAYLLKLWHDH